MDVMERIKQAVDSNPVVIFMKGTPQMPMCGYSSRTAQVLQACGVEFALYGPACGTEVKASDQVCPNCGEVFDD